MSKEPQKLELPPVVFRHRGAVEQIETEQQTFTPVDKFEWRTGKGVFMHLRGGQFPQKGLTSPETMWALNLAKRNFIEILRAVSKWYMVPSALLIAVLPWRRKQRIMEDVLNSYCEVSWRPLSPFLMKTEYMTAVAREIEWAVYTFFIRLGFQPHICERFSEIFATLIEYDNAYRYRVEDIFSETTKKALVENPVKEMVRLFRMYEKRESVSPQISWKFKLVINAMRVAMLHPKIRRAFKEALLEIDVDKLKLDEADRYWVCYREDYMFLGKSNEERRAMVAHLSQPVMVDAKDI